MRLTLECGLPAAATRSRYGRLAGSLGGIWLAALLLAVPAATAGSASLSLYEKNGEPVAQLHYTAAPGEENRIQTPFDWSEDASEYPHRPPAPGAPPRAYLVIGSTLPTAGPGCGSLPPERGNQLRCPIPDGARALGPVIDTGDGDDSVSVPMLEPDTSVSGGAGDDGIYGVGFLDGGPGDDLIFGGGRIRGGAGDDLIGTTGPPFWDWPTRELRAGDDVVVPGPGRDEVNVWAGDDLVRARDGSVDLLGCQEGRDTVVVDEFDWTPANCERVVRSGPPRAVPWRLSHELYTNLVYLLVFCPSDGPAFCRGTATLKRDGRLLAQRPLRLPRADYRGVRFRFGDRQIDRIIKRPLRVSVRSYDRRGVLQTATGTLPVDVYETGD